MDNNEFGILLKALRKQKNMTQEKLATLLNVSTSAVCKWERGNNLPDVSMFQKISEVLDVSIDDLLNPSTSISHLENPSSMENVTAEQACTQAEGSARNETSTIIPTKKRITFGLWRMLIIAIIFVLLFTVGILTYMYISSNKNLHIYPYASRIAEDEYYGMVYEMSYVYEGDFSNLKMDDPFIDAIGDDWIANHDISSNITILKVSFYSHEELAQQWNTPIYSTYFLR